jgi:hypothetical protein
MQRPFKALVWPLALSLSVAGWPVAVQAQMIGTAQVAAAEGFDLRPADDARAMLAATLARADVAAGLRDRGVDPAEALARVQSLDDHEVQRLAQQIDAAPAGAADILGTIVFIFVLLLVTDILGFTKVFPFTRSIR